jgi:ABC-2 type transport system ATP-binding protein
MIEVANLTKTYPGVVAVNAISFRVEKGEIAGFLGLNGAGKSTTMRVLACFIAPTSGSASVAGFDVVRQSMQVRRRVGYLPESNPLYTEMRVEEYLHFRARIKGVARSERVRRVGEVLERVSLSDRRRSIIQHLSKGLRQRVGLADSIVHNPEIIILDEPTIGLDPTQVREIRELIRALGKDKTVLFSSHILSEVEKVCGRVLIIHRGKLVEQGTPDEIANRLMKTGRVRLEIRGDGRSIKESLEKAPGVARILWSAKGDLNTYVVEASDGKDVRGELFRCCASNGWEVLELAYERLTLEEVFSLITEESPAPPLTVPAKEAVS